MLRKVYLGIFIVCVLARGGVCQGQEPSLQDFVDYVENEGKTDADLYKLMSRGPMNGYYKLSFFWDLHAKLHEKYPQFVSGSENYGKTWLENDLDGFILGKGKAFHT